MNFRRLPQPCFAPDTEGAAAPAGDAAPAAQPEATPSTETAPPATEPEKVEAKQDSTESLLSGKEPEKTEGEPDKVAGKEPEAKDGKVEPEKKAADADEPPPPEPLKYEPWTLPEGVKLEGDRLKEAEAILGKANVPQEEAQKLIDLYAQDMKRSEAARDEHQRQVWAEQINKWKDEFRKDPDLGGNRADVTLSTAKAVIEDLGGTKEQQAELLKQLSTSGMGNNLGLIRLLHNIGVKLGVREDGIVASPTSGQGGRQFGQGWYDRSKGEGASA